MSVKLFQKFCRDQEKFDNVDIKEKRKPGSPEYDNAKNELSKSFEALATNIDNALSLTREFLDACKLKPKMILKFVLGLKDYQKRDESHKKLKTVMDEILPFDFLKYLFWFKYDNDKGQNAFERYFWRQALKPDRKEKIKEWNLRHTTKTKLGNSGEYMASIEESKELPHEWFVDVTGWM